MTTLWATTWPGSRERRPPPREKSPGRNSTARKYGVDFAIKRDNNVTPPKYLVFFKAKDVDALTAAFTDYTAKRVKQKNRPSVLARLSKFKELVKGTISKERHHDKGERAL
ncbi:PcfB family protein [Clostridioides difficile]|uniref:PcfB family protein n=1 Tax=Clostridioides difficile TaxID=1496 RepID=UPI00098B24C6|nr:PcfB family protein [Clostridioides difficile]HBF5149277.1 PcfB family protein [Clostridioides difficile]HBF5908339.1 PcfB family protein [Clostridioides difficile]HBF6291213.1 PcfB family protein [Clostridioides difficile]HBF6471473.1 PcfB family protein [Clostridioides difficile]